MIEITKILEWVLLGIGLLIIIVLGIGSGLLFGKKGSEYEKRERKNEKNRE